MDFFLVKHTQKVYLEFFIMMLVVQKLSGISFVHTYVVTFQMLYE